MKTIITLSVSIVVLVAGVLFIYSKYYSKSTQTVPVVTTTFPQSGTSTTVPVNSIKFQLANGGTLTVPDFTKQNQPSWASDTGYLVAGSPTDDFMITYVPADSTGTGQQVAITLQNEPLGEIRKKAEATLKEKFTANNEQLCFLGVSVQTQPGLSDVYGGKELGLSFCPGAVVLP